MYGSTWLEVDGEEKRINFGGLVMHDEGDVVRIVVPAAVAREVQEVCPNVGCLAMVKNELEDGEVEVGMFAVLKSEVSRVKPSHWTGCRKFPDKPAVRPALKALVGKKIK